VINTPQQRCHLANKYEDILVSPIITERAVYRGGQHCIRSSGFLSKYGFMPRAKALNYNFPFERAFGTSITTVQIGATKDNSF